MDLPKPNTTAPDGSPIKLYRLLKPAGEPEIIQSVLRPGSSILELGCGVGRITQPLLEAGYDVVPVDNSPEMLKTVACDKKVQADIETLKLGKEFDAALLMSHFINVPDDALRTEMLETCRRHLAPDGVVIVQRHDPLWLANAAVGFLGDRAGVPTYLDHVERRGKEIDMTIRWEAGDQTWTQSFATRNINGEELDRALQSAGLKFDRWLDLKETWFTARRKSSR